MLNKSKIYLSCQQIIQLLLSNPLRYEIINIPRSKYVLINKFIILRMGCGGSVSEKDQLKVYTPAPQESSSVPAPNKSPN